MDHLRLHGIAGVPRWEKRVEVDWKVWDESYDYRKKAFLDASPVKLQASYDWKNPLGEVYGHVWQKQLTRIVIIQVV